VSIGPGVYESRSQEKLTPYTKGFVTSADGTRIGYRQLGGGPGVVLLHGGVNGSQHLMRLGIALAGTFTVYPPTAAAAV
jgi:pimeloyl-ACP methyl ester carboxylesterase